MTLQPGDVLLYKPSSFFGTLIKVHTGHAISHVELYLGNEQSSASRDGIGVNIYPLRTSSLTAVMRPKPPFHFNEARARAFTAAYAGTPYGWLDLLDFFGFSIRAKGIVCSPWVTTVLRDNGLPIFNDDPANLIAPFQFEDSELLEKVPQ